MTDDAAGALLLVRRVPENRRKFAEAFAGTSDGWRESSENRPPSSTEWWEVVEAAAECGFQPRGVALRTLAGTKADIRAVTVRERKTAALLMGQVVAALQRDGAETVLVHCPDKFTADALTHLGFVPAANCCVRTGCSSVRADCGGTAVCWLLQL